MVNEVTLIGNLGKDPETRTLENGAKVANFSLATSESYKDKSGEWQEKTEWHNVQAWRTLAERAEATLRKGATIFLKGKLSTRKWQDKNGNDRYTTEVVASYFRIINKGGSSQESKPYNHDLGNQDPSGKSGDDDLPF